VGGVAAGLVILVAVFALIFIRRRRTQRKMKKAGQENESKNKSESGSTDKGAGITTTENAPIIFQPQDENHLYSPPVVVPVALVQNSPAPAPYEVPQQYTYDQYQPDPNAAAYQNVVYVADPNQPLPDGSQIYTPPILPAHVANVEGHDPNSSFL